MIRVARFSGPLSFYEEEGRNRTMELLKQRIRKDGTVKGNDVLKVDSFLNHQMDVALFEEIGKEFKRLYADCGVNKILTIEASGIGIACVTAQSFHCPVVFAKKSQSKNIDGAVYSTKVKSFTHGKVYDVIVSKKFLGPEDRVLIIDQGTIAQYGRPAEIIQKPENDFVRKFILNQLEIKRNNIYALFGSSANSIAG